MKPWEAQILAVKLGPCVGGLRAPQRDALDMIAERTGVRHGDILELYHALLIVARSAYRS
jgi:hypothetical protein